jgi:aspartate aminotransferase
MLFRSLLPFEFLVMQDSFIAKRLQTVQLSPTLAMAATAREMEKAGKEVIHLEIGEPDFPTLPCIKEAGIQAIKENKNYYTPISGTAEIKKAIIQRYKNINQLDYSPAEIMVSTGAKQCLYNTFQALFDPGDEILIPSPYWVSYPDMAYMAQALPVFIETSSEQRFKITAAQLEEAITPKTKALLLNSPSNPSGMLYSRSELKALGVILKKHPNVWIISDDIYEHLLWSKEPFCNILMANPDLKERTVLINGVSKAFAMTGWRIGYCATHQSLISAMSNFQSQVTSGACSIAQAAACQALYSSVEELQPMVHSFKERHEYVVKKINAIPGLHCLEGDGTFYAFINIKDALKKKVLSSDLDFCSQLLEKKGIALVPGSAFGMPGFARLSFCVEKELLKKAMEQLNVFVTD